MKKIIIILFFTGLCTIVFNSCLEEYLDKAPESGLTEEEVFTKYANFLKYFNSVYTGYQMKYTATAVREFNLKSAVPMWWCQSQTFSTEGLTPMCDQGYLAGSSHNIKSGVFSPWWIEAVCYNFVYPVLSSMFMAIRTANTTIEKIDMLTDATQKDKDDLLAQAYFVRGFAHFELVKWWGGMPYIINVIGPDDQWDLPRLTPHATLFKVAADMDTAVIYFEKAGTMRRDPGPGGAGHLNHPDQHRPTGVSAKAYKARALLYAASPLNNTNGVADWAEAAKASWEAIQVAEQNNYSLLSAKDYKLNTVGSRYTNEMLWGWYLGNFGYTSFGSLVPGVFTNTKTASGQAPSQNCVDMFETKWGDPLNTEEDRIAAAALGHYNEQDPYNNRDPRFYIDIIYNQAPIMGFGTADIYFEVIDGVPVYARHLDQNYPVATHTGYHDRKHWGNQSVLNKVSTQYTDPMIRLAELYLGYAEAANEAYGPNSPAPGASMTAVQAANKIRARIGQVDFPSQYTASKENFRPRIKNERTIELMFEGHYYHDIRRWMDAPGIYEEGLWGVDIEKVAVSKEYPTGFRYTRRKLPAIRQTRWKPQMYYWPFTATDNFKMKNFVPNPDW